MCARANILSTIEICNSITLCFQLHLPTEHLDMLEHGRPHWKLPSAPFAWMGSEVAPSASQMGMMGKDGGLGSVLNKPWGNEKEEKGKQQKEQSH